LPISGNISELLIMQRPEVPQSGGCSACHI
jgi:hypothetical protein